MTEKSGVFAGNPIATEIELARLFQGFQLDGVRGNPNDTACQVIPDGGLNIKVRTGYAHVAGYWYESLGDGEVRAVAANAATQPRKDLVVLRADPEADKVTVAIRQGTPLLPDPVRQQGGVWELPLARVRVAPGAASIGVADIEDAREFAGTTIAPSHSTDRPDRPAMGQLIYETNTGRWVGYTGGTTPWRTVAEDTGWINLSPAWTDVWQVGWALKARRLNGICYLRGALRRIKSTYGKGDADGTLLTILPANLRPFERHSPAMVCDHGSKGGYVVPGRMDINPDNGEVRLMHVSADVPVGHYAFLSTTWIGR
ncbi:hypothetical protein BZB76_6128 [Actinomadura pelletieri DSM 43383]|uniref:Uncharacterized protein n=1 Tax=Actinomadura pelletieri DSM 43383 TaxID=1120940 RepID=A0A495QBC4_9ACTN|nr:hypothetical protein [Actinomadura pelletieri]RKS68989.1 hypothetical protein BZB76_6128 [Actinomadura pelletieri DSM 43383]